MVRKQDQIRGAVLGTAAGDALGYCVEELSLEEIQQQFGPQGIQGYDMLNGYAQITFNTQLALYTANALLYGDTRGGIRGVRAPYVSYLELFYKEWLTTQAFRKTTGTRPAPGSKNHAWLSCVQDLYFRRNTDRTTFLILDQGRLGTMAEPTSRSRSAGCLTRVYPVGLHMDPKVYCPKEIATVGAEAAALTHGDPLAFLSAACLTDTINRILFYKPQGFRATIHGALDDMNQWFGGEYPRAVADLEEILGRAEELADGNMESTEALEALRPEEAHSVLAAAVYVCLKYPGDFDRGIVAAVNHGGSSSAVAAVAGAIYGTALGTEGIPEFYLEPLELREVMEELADDLFQGCSLSRQNLLFDDQWNDKYVECTY